MIEIIRNAAVAAIVSALITGFGVYYLHLYIDGRRKESDERVKKRREERLKRDVLEQKRRRAEGRCFFWMHDAIVNGVAHANGDLDKAFSDYSVIEEEQKAYEQELLAEHTDENRG